MLLFDNGQSEPAASLNDFGMAGQPNMVDMIGFDNMGAVYPPEVYGDMYDKATEQYMWASALVYPLLTGSLYGEASENGEYFGEDFARFPFEIVVPKGMTYYHEAVEPLVERALSPFPGDRYPSMAELHDDFMGRLAYADIQVRRRRKHIT